MDSDQSQTSTSNTTDQLAALTDLNNKLKAGLSDGSINVGAPILDYATNHYIFNDDGSKYSSGTNQQ